MFAAASVGIWPIVSVAALAGVAAVIAADAEVCEVATV